jgi:enoyl-CoA hydratase/carnithine racemase
VAAPKLSGSCGQCRALSSEASAAPEQEPELLIANAPGLRIIDLNRPKVLNSLNGAMVRTLLPLVQDWQQPNGDVHLVVLRGSSERAFCAGGDIRFLYDCASIGEGPPLAAAHAFFYDEYTLNHALGTSRVPIVSLLEGIVMGGGVGLSVHGHVRVASESTLFAMPETGIGFFPDVGATHFLPRLRSPALGAYLGLTGARLSGRDVATAGAVVLHAARLRRSLGCSCGRARVPARVVYLRVSL